ncbi:transglutaminase-like domain-containing protein [Gluconacetobacter tumulisoli]|uniref:transglutaminase-like domain-containing protein n=1 Tax=Gluconacetobacter tumulisoli TaxID=1286189 RepID=UPI0030845AF7
MQVQPAAGEDVTIGAEICFRPRPASDAANPPDRDLYLRPDEGLIKLSDPIAALARRLGGDAAPDIAVRAFWDFMIDEFLSGPVHYDQIGIDAPLDWVLEARCCDCQLGSAFFVALCRAHGIPARLVSGHFLYRRSPTLHYWSEVWLDNQGWASFDFMSWDLSMGGQDPAWRDHFFGRVDARMITQCLPRAFTGSVGVTIPPTWRILQTSRGDGVDISLIGPDGTSIYNDHVAVS